MGFLAILKHFQIVLHNSITQFYGYPISLNKYEVHTVFLFTEWPEDCTAELNFASLTKIGVNMCILWLHSDNALAA